MAFFWQELKCVVAAAPSLLLWPLRALVFATANACTRALDPYQKCVAPSTLKASAETIQGMLPLWEDRADTLMYRGFHLCEVRGLPANGLNHYVSDWCSFEGDRVAALRWKAQATKSAADASAADIAFTQYLNNWVDANGYLCRGWTWRGDGGKDYTHRISIDQVAHFVHALSVQPWVVLARNQAPIRRLALRFIADGLRFLTPDASDEYNTRCMPWPWRGGVHAAAAQALLAFAADATGDEDFEQLRRIHAVGAAAAMAAPIARAGNLVPGFNFNITLLALKAAWNRTVSTPALMGMRSIYKAIKLKYNPWWALVLADAGIGTDNDIAMAAYQLTTASKLNWRDYDFDDWFPLHFGGDPEPIERKRGEYALPPPLASASGDCSITQGGWRDVEHFGFKPGATTRSDREYNGSFFVNAAWLLEKIMKSRRNA